MNNNTPSPMAATYLRVAASVVAGEDRESRRALGERLLAFREGESSVNVHIMGLTFELLESLRDCGFSIEPGALFPDDVEARLAEAAK